MSERLRTVVVMAVTVLVAGVCLEYLPSSPLRGTFRQRSYRLNAEVAATTEGPHAWVMTQPGDRDRPVSYDPCRPVEVLVNPDGGPAEGPDLVRSAIARVNQATGLDLQYAGASDERPAWVDGNRPVPRSGPAEPVLVSWATQAEAPQLAGDVAGVAGSVARADRSGRLRFITGQVTLDSEAFGQLAGERDGDERMRAVVLHEFGHLVGLAHVKDAGELMNAKLRVLDFGPGDLEGLALLGRGGCH